MCENKTNCLDCKAFYGVNLRNPNYANCLMGVKNHPHEDQCELFESRYECEAIIEGEKCFGNMHFERVITIDENRYDIYICEECNHPFIEKHVIY